MQKRLARGDPGINPLDAACKEHDIAYDNKNSDVRYVADKELQKRAMERVFAKDASIGERATALGVAASMKIKRKLTKSGKGLQKKKKKLISLTSLIKNARSAIKQAKPDNIDSAIKLAVASVKKFKKGKHVKKPRIIKLPSYSGGVLPLLPIFAGLSALGSIVGSATGIMSAINKVKSAQKQLGESKRHNETMEAIAIGKRSGSGFYLHTNKTGDGFFLSPNPKNH